MVLDEIYSFCQCKEKKIYIWTAIAQDKKGNTYKFFHISKKVDWLSLYDFTYDIPDPVIAYTDGAGVYPSFYYKKHWINSKWFVTNEIESLNAQVRQYCSRLRRKTKAYTKNVKNLYAQLAMIFMIKLIN